MDSETFLKITTDSISQEIKISHEVILEITPENVKVVDNIGHLKFTIDEDVLSFKVLSDLEGTLDSHPLKVGSIYFLEDDSDLTLGDHKIEKIHKEVEASANDGFEVSLPAENTVTSIDVGKLLQKANGTKKTKKKVKKKAPRVKEEQGPGMGAARVKKEKPAETVFQKKARKKEENFLNESKVGPFLRLFAVLTNICLVIFLYPLYNNEFLTEIATKVAGILNGHIKPIIDLTAPIDLIKILIVLVIYEFISRILFSVSFPQFLCGVSTYGNFVPKRIKAIIRFPFDMLSIVFPFIDIPILLGKKPIKEFITRGQIYYTTKALKPMSVVIYPLLIIVAIAHPLLLSGDFSTQVKLISKSKFKKKSAAYNANAYVDYQVNENFYFKGITDRKKSHYLLVNKSNAASMEIKQVRNYDFKRMDKFANEIPFFDKLYPFLNNYLQTGETNKKVREDVLKIFKTGEIIAMRDNTRLLDIDLFAITTGHRLFSEFSLPSRRYQAPTDYYRIYEKGKDRIAVLIGEHSIKTFSIKYSQDMEPMIHNLVHLGHTGSDDKTPFDKIFATNSLVSQDYLDHENEVADTFKQAAGAKEKKLYKSLLKKYIMETQKSKDAEVQLIGGELQRILQNFE